MLVLYATVLVKHIVTNMPKYHTVKVVILSTGHVSLGLIQVYKLICHIIMKYHKLAPTNDLNTWPVPNKQFDWSL